MAAVVIGIVGISAYEAHIINVTAQIENALEVNTTPIEFGTVFPQEVMYRDLKISLSSSFLEENDANDVDYVIKQKPKVRVIDSDTGLHDPYAVITPDGYPDGIVAHEYCLNESPTDPGDPKDPYYIYCYPNLCGQLSKHKDVNDQDGNDTELNVPHDPDQFAIGRLVQNENDTEDDWVIDLKVPCFEGMCDQTYDPEFYGEPFDPRLEHEVFGCDLWVEVTGISRFTDEGFPEMFVKTLENKDPSNGWPIVDNDNIYGLLSFSSVEGSGTIEGSVEAFELIPLRRYQITLNGPIPGTGCTATDDLLAGAGANLFESGYWNGGPGLDAACIAGGEGAYNMGVTDGTVKYYTVETDANGYFKYDFSISGLTPGIYTGVRVLVKMLLEPFNSPWVDVSDIMHSNLYEVSSIDFIVN